MSSINDMPLSVIFGKKLSRLIGQDLTGWRIEVWHMQSITFYVSDPNSSPPVRCYRNKKMAETLKRGEKWRLPGNIKSLKVPVLTKGDGMGYLLDVRESNGKTGLQKR